MKEELLDDDLPTPIKRKIPIGNLALIVWLDIAFHLFLERFRPLIAAYDWSFSDTTIPLMGVINFLVLILIALMATHQFNQVEPEFPLWKVVVGTGILILITGLLLRIIQSVLWEPYLLNKSYLLNTIHIAIIGMLISNVRIHNSRKSNKKWPFLLLIGGLIAPGIYHIYFST